MVDSDVCPGCGLVDDLLHYLYECPHISTFWNDLLNWLGNGEGQVDFPGNLQEQDILLGITGKDYDVSLENYFLLIGKFYVYKTVTFGDGQLDLSQFLVELKNRLMFEHLCCYADQSYHHRFKKWQWFYNGF